MLYNVTCFDESEGSDTRGPECRKSLSGSTLIALFARLAEICRSYLGLMGSGLYVGVSCSAGCRSEDGETTAVTHLSYPNHFWQEFCFSAVRGAISVNDSTVRSVHLMNRYADIYSKLAKLVHVSRFTQRHGWRHVAWPSHLSFRLVGPKPPGQSSCHSCYKS